MKLDYYTLLCPVPISLSIGTIKHPTLREIGRIGYTRFGMYQVYLKLTPSNYYLFLGGKSGKEYWDNLSGEEQKETSLYDVLLLDHHVLYTYLEIFNFFFLERVIFRDGLFLIIDTDDYGTPQDEIDLEQSNIRGIINSTTFVGVLDLLQQICCIKSDDILDEAKPRFKNNKAKQLYERMLKAKEEQKKKTAEKDSLNMTLPNIVSSVAAKSPGLNIVNIWDATLFQIYDQFGKTQNDDVHYLNTVRVAVWGDEKNQFDQSLWYKNNFDKH